MLVGYARVSTDLQTTDGQIDALHAAGCERVFEESMSGTRADRPQLAAALEFAREGDVLVVARLDRLARSMRQLLSTVDTLAARGIGLRSLHENIDTTSATGRLILHIFAALGQFEVELLRERTRTALAASRARGRVGGRPPALDAIKVRAAKAMLASGTMTASEVARQVGCSASTLYRHVPGGRAAVDGGRVHRRLIRLRVSISRGGIRSRPRPIEPGFPPPSASERHWLCYAASGGLSGSSEAVPVRLTARAGPCSPASESTT